MQTKATVVKSDSVELGEAQYPEYETVDEAVNHPEYGLGEKQLLKLLNAQVRTNAMNTLRTNKTKGPTKKTLRNEATNQIIMEMVEKQMHQEAVGNPEILETIVDRRMAELEAEAKASMPVAIEEGSEE